MALVQASVLVMAQAPVLALELGQGMEPGMERHKEILVMGIRQEAINADCLVNKQFSSR
jgi:hypothetical protein